MNGGRILVVEDEPAIADVVEYALSEHNFRTVTAHDGDRAWAVFRESEPDLVILDLRLPGIPGLDLFRRMRDLRPAVPIIMLTSRTDEADRVAGLELGADDYVTKPFSPRELVARVRTVLRRASAPAAGPGGAVQAGPLCLRPEEFRCAYHGVEVLLSRQEFSLLLCLARHPARIFTRNALIEAIYSGEGIVTDRSVDAQVKRIRQKLAAVRADGDPIQTVYGIGYKLNQDIEDQA